MKTDEIVQGNEAIDVFMDNWLRDRGFYDSELNYHISWDCLMPVINRISNTKGALSYFEKGNYIVNSWSTLMVCSENILGVYGEVVEFIKWYNTKLKDK